MNIIFKKKLISLYNMEKIRIKYKDFDKTIEIPNTIVLGDIIEKILSICNLLIYDIETIFIKYTE